MLKSAFRFAVCIVVSLLSSLKTEAAIRIANEILVDVRLNGNNVQIPMDCYLVEYTLGDGAQGCPVSKYDKTVIVTAPTFPVIFGGITYTEAHHRAYWDWIYDPYTGNSCDWTMNCHGHAFSVGDWPHWSNTLISSGSAPHCWVEDVSNATLASDYGHSVVISVYDCPLSVGLRVLSANEKFCESGIYSMTGDCSMPINIVTIGNDRRYGIAFTYYKHQ